MHGRQDEGCWGLQCIAFKHIAFACSVAGDFARHSKLLWFLVRQARRSALAARQDPSGGASVVGGGPHLAAVPRVAVPFFVELRFQVVSRLSHTAPLCAMRAA